MENWIEGNLFMVCLLNSKTKYGISLTLCEDNTEEEMKAILTKPYSKKLKEVAKKFDVSLDDFDRILVKHVKEEVIQKAHDMKMSLYVVFVDTSTKWEPSSTTLFCLHENPSILLDPELHEELIAETLEKHDLLSKPVDVFTFQFPVDKIKLKQ